MSGFIGAANDARAQMAVKIIAYDFPPYFSVSEDGKLSGVGVDYIDALNDLQEQYQFSLKVTAPKRRYRDIVFGQADMIFFEMPEWGWKTHQAKINVSQEILNGGEFFIAHQDLAKGQNFFDTIKNKQMIGVLGYHYGFAQFNSDTEYLKNNFSIILVDEPMKVFEAVLKKRVEVGIVSLANYNLHKITNPKAAANLIASKKYDQRYSLRVIANVDAPISIAELEVYLEALYRKKVMHQIVSKYGMEEQLTFQPD